MFVTDLIYVFMWSLGLLYASFHTVFEGTSPSTLCLKPLPALLENYIFPMSMAMILFLLDCIYNLLKAAVNLKFELVAFLVLFILFWLFFLFTLMYRDDAAFSNWSFWVAWVCLALMKFLTTHCSSLSENYYPSVHLPNNA